MKILAIGDVIGGPGRDILRALLPGLREELALDAVIANAENSAGGIGTTAETANALFGCGIDVLTGGNHTWKHREYEGPLERDPRLLRPHNYPKAPGRGLGIYTTKSGIQYAVLNLIGRTFMDPVDNPFVVVEALLAEAKAKTPIVFVDFHAEATGEKQSFGHHLDGRVSAVWGTHTHCPTADERILPKGTAFVTDLGLTGPYNSVIGFNPEQAIRRYVTSRPTRFEVGSGQNELRGLVVTVDDTSGRALAVDRIKRTA